MLTEGIPMTLQTRRDFLRNAALFSTAGFVPQFLTLPWASLGASATEDAPILVVVQLGGGNDGLNTVIPYNQDAYYQLRPTLALSKKEMYPLTDALALHGRMTEWARLYDEGKLAIVENVGYPNPDRSHFRAMEIWHTASDSGEYLSSGWLGRYFDNACAPNTPPYVGVAVGERPQAFDNTKGFGIAAEDPRRFGWMPGSHGDTWERFRAVNSLSNPTDNPTLDFLRHVTHAADLAAQDVQRAASRGRIDEAQLTPKRGFQPLQTVAGLIRGGLAARVYYVSAGGFDTHAQQRGQHDLLLERAADAIAAFQRTLERDKLAERVVTLVFSEFGRRVKENGSRGTDHGTAAPVFVIGEKIRPGIFGSPPNLEDLDDGDLKHTTDFRSVYATLLEDWLNVSSSPILFRTFDKLPLFA